MRVKTRKTGGFLGYIGLISKRKACFGYWAIGPYSLHGVEVCWALDDKPSHSGPWLLLLYILCLSLSLCWRWPTLAWPSHLLSGPVSRLLKTGPCILPPAGPAG